MTKNNGITLFTWGYWGWGSATPALVAAAAAVERTRGFGPPLFVDVRRLRDVRAAGFRGDAFEKVAGRENYRWMPSLGNPLVGSEAPTSAVTVRAEELRGGAARGTRRLRVVDLAAGDQLLDLAIERARGERHVIAFCSCGSPFEDGERACHRTDVAELVRTAAAKRGVALRTIEWPGGEPTLMHLDVEGTVARAIAKGTRNSIPLGPDLPAPELLGLPWASQVRVAEDLLVVSGPARCDAKGWSLPVLLQGDATDKQGQKDARTWRSHNGYGAFEAARGTRSEGSRTVSSRSA